MPMIDAKLTVKLTAQQDQQVHEELTNAAAAELHKPASYVMLSVEQGADLWMGGRKVAKGAYVHVRAFGGIADADAAKLTARITKFFEQGLGLDGAAVYISYQGLNQWGWQGSMF